MNRCPHCQVLCRPHRLIWMTKWTPYACPKCQKLSAFRWWQNAISGGMGGGLAVLVIRQLDDQMQQPWFIAVPLTFLSVFFLIILVQFLFFKLHPVIIDDEEAESMIQGE